MDSEKPSHVEQTALTDSQLWQAMIQGQAEALGILYDRHVGLVYGIALKILVNPQEAEDLTHDIFVRLMQQSYDPKRGSLRTFLAILTRSRAIDRWRSHQRATEKAKQYLHVDSPTTVTLPEDSGEREEQNQEVHSALAKLPEQQQQLLTMTYYEGLTQAAIAERLDLPLGTVKSTVRRGLLKLRQILQNQLD